MTIKTIDVEELRVQLKEMSLLEDDELYSEFIKLVGDKHGVPIYF